MHACTGLVGVEEVLAGTRVSLDPGGGATRAGGWTPWTFAAADRQITDGSEWRSPEFAQGKPSAAVAAWASRSKSILLELSGGLLDSSIVAACLPDQAAAIACVTAVTPDPGADERRRYAALVAAQIGACSEAVMLEVASGDAAAAAAAAAAALPALCARPGCCRRGRAPACCSRFFDTAFADQGQDPGRGRLLHWRWRRQRLLLPSTAAAAPAADVLRTQEPWPLLFMRTVGELATLHGMHGHGGPGAWPSEKPGGAGQGRGGATLRFSRAPRSRPRRNLHPWPAALDAPAGCSGKFEHIVALMRIQNAPDGKERHGVAPIRYPLLSQPLARTLPGRSRPGCGSLGVVNRAVARDAFADRLPAAITWSAGTKGDFTGFCGAIFERQKAPLADLLLGGWLAGRAFSTRSRSRPISTRPARRRTSASIVFWSSRASRPRGPDHG